MSQPALHGTACKVCRRRGRKCDRTLPTCLACEKRGVQCEGYVTRWPGVAARGKLAGKSIPVVGGDEQGDAIPPKNLNLRQGDRPRIRKPVMKDWMLDQSALRPTMSTALQPVHFDEKEVDKLVEHYINDLSSIFYLGDGPSLNPMFHYVLPLVNTVAPIRYALAASAACHTAARTSDEALDEKSLSLRVHATSLLRDRLLAPNLATYSTMLPSILMMAQLDMCSGDCVEFETHMKAGVAMCRANPADHSSNRFYFEQRLAWLDIISSTTSTRLPFFNYEELKTALGRFSANGSREWSYDVFPCSVDLCETLLDTLMLHKTRLNDSIEPSEGVIERTQAIMERLHSWTYMANGLEGPREHLIQAWRLGITAYLKRLFPSVGYHESDTEASARSAQLLYHARLIPLATSWSFPLLWPIFQVSVSLDDAAIEEKAWVREYLRVSLEAVGCRHFSNALETLEHVWANSEQLANSAIGTFGRTIMLG